MPFKRKKEGVNSCIIVTAIDFGRNCPIKRKRWENDYVDKALLALTTSFLYGGFNWRNI